MLPSVQFHTVDYGGRALRVSVRETGAGDQPTVVLLHALGNDSRSYEMQFAALAQTCHVLAWDAPGFGESDPLPSEEVEREAFSQVLAATLEGLGLSSVCLVSTSFGTLPALQLAAQRPDLVASLVLAAPSIGLGARPADERQAIYAQRREMGNLPAAEFAQRFAPLLVAPGATSALVDCARRHGEVIRREGYLAALQIMVQTDGLAVAAEVRQPVLLLVGRDDQLTPPGQAAEPLSKVLQQAELRVLDGVGHSPHIEAVEVFNLAVAEFARAHAPRASIAKDRP